MRGGEQLWVGLGNPGSGHRLARHNVGFMVVESIGRRHGFSRWSRLEGGRRRMWQRSRGRIGDVSVCLLEPLTYMNLSGDAVGSVVGKLRLAVSDILVIHDELDLSLGRVKVKTGGGDAGHNGLRSISGAIGGGYRRLRIGIGRGEDTARDYVLSSFSREERDGVVEPLTEAIAEHIGFLAMNDEENDNRFLSAMDLAMREVRGGHGVIEETGGSIR
ncbi:MAG: aminoacyl-tRNA hydrolase [Alphaproteobacteria bacterium]